LSKVKGVGPGTIDYLKLASGLQATAGGSRIEKFLEQAGLAVDDYADTNAVVARAAELLGVPVRKLDASIWHYMDTQTS
jgi:hypothetical protein